MTSGPATSWVADFYFGQVLDDKAERERDPGLPAYPWLPDGRLTPTIGGAALPVSFVAAATGRKYLPLINLDQLRRSTFNALDGKPDTRTPQQRSRDDWAAFQAAKEKYERHERDRAREAAPQEEDGPGAAQEQAPGSAEEGAAVGAPGPVGDGGSPGGEPADLRERGGSPA